jgi:hypothetical protein
VRSPRAERYFSEKSDKSSRWSLAEAANRAAEDRFRSSPDVRDLSGDPAQFLSRETPRRRGAAVDPQEPRFHRGHHQRPATADEE